MFLIISQINSVLNDSFHLGLAFHYYMLALGHIVWLLRGKRRKEQGNGLEVKIHTEVIVYIRICVRV